MSEPSGSRGPESQTRTSPRLPPGPQRPPKGQTTCARKQVKPLGHTMQRAGRLVSGACVTWAPGPWALLPPTRPPASLPPSRTHFQLRPRPSLQAGPPGRPTEPGPGCPTARGQPHEGTTHPAAAALREGHLPSVLRRRDTRKREPEGAPRGGRPLPRARLAPMGPLSPVPAVARPASRRDTPPTAGRPSPRRLRRWRCPVWRGAGPGPPGARCGACRSAAAAPRAPGTRPPRARRRTGCARAPRLPAG